MDAGNGVVGALSSTVSVEGTTGLSSEPLMALGVKWKDKRQVHPNYREKVSQWSVTRWVQEEGMAFQTLRSNFHFGRLS